MLELLGLLYQAMAHLGCTFDFSHPVQIQYPAKPIDAYLKKSQHGSVGS
jgi:hypothetical protein